MSQMVDGVCKLPSHIPRCTSRDCYCGNCSEIRLGPRNQSKIECQCFKGWIDDDIRDCYIQCNRTCSTGSMCVIRNDQQHCSSVGTRPTSTTAETTIAIDVHTTVVVTVSIVVPLLVIFVVALVILWRKRVLFLLKIVHHLKAYDDKEDRQYDAFISYKSSSRDLSTSSAEEVFVVSQLLPTMEQHFGYTLCVHFRDFVPGMMIADNVLHAIDNSHRTIMLISPAYVAESVWSRFEYEQAQIAVIEQKQRIIPILFEPMSDLDISDPTLTLILKSTTYLEKPTDENDAGAMEEFWTRLRLSMPKKRRDVPRPI